jgi:hypothetical protein
MGRILWIACFAVFCLLVGCGKDEGTNPTSGESKGSMTVTVRRNNAAVPLAVVVASPAGGSGAAADIVATTDQSGMCVLSAVSQGTYSVAASVSIGGTNHYGQNTGISVSGGSNTNVEVLLLAQKADYWPMALGNWWSLSSGDTIAIGPVKIIKGVATYAIGLRGQVVHPGYHTHGSNAIYQHGYETTTGADHIIDPPTVWIDFTATAGECWVIRDWGQGCLQSEWDTVQTPMGLFTDCWKVRLVAENRNEFYFWLKEGVGPVKLTAHGETGRLTNYQLF